MAEPIALVTGDWHVRKFDRVWYRRDGLAGDTAWGIKQVVRVMEERDVPCALLLGDLFEQKLQQSDALETMRLALDTFEHRGQPVFYVQGQHERSDPPVLSAMHSWPQHIHGTRARLGYQGTGPEVQGLDYQSPTDVKEALEAVDCDILATHQVWRDYLGQNYGDAWLSWAARAKYVLTGDFHQSIWEQRGQQWVLSPGSLCMQKIDEPADKYVFILNDDMSAEKIRIPTRGYFEARLHNQDELEQFLDTWNNHPARIPKADVPPTLSMNIIRVWYRTDITDARQRLEAKVSPDAHLFLKSIPVEVAQVSADQEQRVAAVLSGGLAGCIRTFYAGNASVCTDAVRLAQTRDIQTELEHIFKELVYHGSTSQREGALQGASQDADGGAAEGVGG